MSIVPLRRSFDDGVEAQRAITDFQSDADEILARKEPRLVRSTLYVVALMVISFIVWASVATIDRVVQARGKLVSTSPSIVLQPLDTAIIKSIKVRAGDVVKAGQVLATLDATFAQADVAQMEVRLQTLDAMVARLEAEYEGRPYEPIGANVTDAERLQASIYRERQAQFRAQMQSFDERILRLESNIDRYKREREFLASQLTSLKSIEDIRNTLAAAQVGSKLNALAANASRLDAERNLATSNAAYTSSLHELDDNKAQRNAFGNNWKTQLSQELATQRSERNQLLEQLIKAKRRDQLVTMTAPTDAVVLDVAPLSVNSVARAAEALFTLVPMDAPLEVECSIDAGKIGFVREGDKVQIKFDAYHFYEHGLGEGVVRTISEDSFSQKGGSGAGTGVGGSDRMSNGQDPSDGASGLFYRARLTLTNTQLRNVPDSFRLVPGLPLTAEIKVGHRTIMSYLLRPLLYGFGQSMREP